MVSFLATAASARDNIRIGQLTLPITKQAATTPGGRFDLQAAPSVSTQIMAQLSESATLQDDDCHMVQRLRWRRLRMGCVAGLLVTL